MELLLVNAALASALALVVAATAALVRRPTFAHRAWLLVVFKLLLPPLAVVPLFAPTIDAAILDKPAALTPDSGEPLPVWRAVPESPRWTWTHAVVGVWLFGTVAYWALVGVRVLRFARVARLAPDADELREEVSVAAKAIGLRRRVRVRWLDAAVSPFAWGRSSVFLPRELWATLGADERLTVLAHELAHLARGDVWVRRLEVLAIGLYWWLPVAWLARRRLRQAEEACCDQRVVAAWPHLAEDYANALVEAAAFLRRPLAVPLACGGAARGPELRRRLTMILTPPTKSRPWAVGILGGVVLLALPWRPGFADDPPAPKPIEVKGVPLIEKPAAADILYEWVRLPDGVGKRSATDVQNLRDEVELAEATLRVKQTRLTALRESFKEVAREVEYAKGLRANGAKRESDYIQILGQLPKSQAEVGEAELECLAADIKLRQARRRLAEAMNVPHVHPEKVMADPLSKTPTVAAPAKSKAVAGTPLSVEQRIEILQKEIDALRKQVATPTPNAK